MLEITRELVRRFNQIYSEVLVEPTSCSLRIRQRTVYQAPTVKREKRVWQLHLPERHTRGCMAVKVRSMCLQTLGILMFDPGKVEGLYSHTPMHSVRDNDFTAFWSTDYKNLEELKTIIAEVELDMKCKKFLIPVINNMLNQCVPPSWVWAGYTWDIQHSKERYG